MLLWLLLRDHKFLSQEFFNLPERIILHGEMDVGEVAEEIVVGECSGCVNCCWRSCERGTCVGETT